MHAQVTARVEKATRDGKPYFQLQMADSADSFTLRMWSDHPQFQKMAGLPSGEQPFVAVTGEFAHTGSFGLEARRWAFRFLEDAEREALLAGGGERKEIQEAAWRTVEKLCESIGDPALHAVCKGFLGEYGVRLRRAAAARVYHHARRGGLLEHIAQMMRAADVLCGVYPALNKDLLLAGVLFHDSGKLWENHVPENSFAMPYDDRAELLGHIVMGIELVNTLWRKHAPDPNHAGARARLHLAHLIAAHHGELMYGSPVAPKTPEAMALHYIDNLDAKLEMFDRGYRNAACLGSGVFERVHPLPGTLVEALAVHIEGVALDPSDAIEEMRPG